VKAVNQNGEGFWYQQQQFPCISDAKIKEQIFAGPQINELVNYRNFDEVI
jgi:hypothetical protein